MIAMRIIRKSGDVDEGEQARRRHNEAHIKESFARKDVGDGDETQRISKRFSAGFTDIVFGGVTKSQPPGGGVREFMPGDAVLDRTEPDEAGSVDLDSEDARMGSVLASWSGKGTVEQPRPAWAVDSFLAPTGMYSVKPQPVYGIVEDPGIAPPRSPNFMGHGISDGLAEPASFAPPRPGGVRMGDGRLLKREAGFWAGAGPHVPLTMADVAHMAIKTVDTEALAAITKKTGIKVVDADWSGLAGPRRWDRGR